MKAAEPGVPDVGLALAASRRAAPAETAPTQPRPTTSADGRQPYKPASEISAKSSRLWLWFVAAFVLQAAAWTAWFVIAANHQVAEVPLARPTTEPVQ